MDLTAVLFASGAGGRTLFLRVGVQPFAALSLGLLAVFGEFALSARNQGINDHDEDVSSEDYGVSDPHSNSCPVRSTLNHINRKKDFIVASKFNRFFCKRTQAIIDINISNSHGTARGCIAEVSKIEVSLLGINAVDPKLLSVIHSQKVCNFIDRTMILFFNEDIYAFACISKRNVLQIMWFSMLEVEIICRPQAQKKEQNDDLKMFFFHGFYLAYLSYVCL